MEDAKASVPTALLAVQPRVFQDPLVGVGALARPRVLRSRLALVRCRARGGLLDFSDPSSSSFLLLLRII